MCFSGSATKKADVTLNRMCSAAELVPDDECTVDEGDGGIEDEEGMTDSESPGGAEVLMGENNFKPIYAIGKWQDPDDSDTGRVSVAILMFSGMRKQSDYMLNVVDGGLFLEYKVFWPAAIADTYKLHSMWIDGKGGARKIVQYHPMVRSFLPFIGRLRRAQDSKVEITARIPLPVKVETRFEEHVLQWTATGERILYIVLKQPTKQALVCDNGEIAFVQF